MSCRARGRSRAEHGRGQRRNVRCARRVVYDRRVGPLALGGGGAQPPVLQRRVDHDLPHLIVAPRHPPAERQLGRRHRRLQRRRERPHRHHRRNRLRVTLAVILFLLLHLHHTLVAVILLWRIAAATGQPCALPSRALRWCRDSRRQPPPLAARVALNPLVHRRGHVLLKATGGQSGLLGCAEVFVATHLRLEATHVAFDASEERGVVRPLERQPLRRRLPQRRRSRRLRASARGLWPRRGRSRRCCSGH
jgi:hypothetical protein